MKFKKIISAVVCLMVLTSVCACSDNEPVEEEKKVITGEYILNDFESYVPDFSLIRVLNSFGAINVNTDAKYVKSGKSSAKLQPLGGYPSMGKPVMYYPLHTDKYGFDLRDLSRVKSVFANIYNAESKDINMTFGVVMEVVNTDMVNTGNLMDVVLKPGWNRVAYNIDPSILNILYDVTNGQGVYFGFDRVGSRNIEDAPCLYLDDIGLYLTDRPAKVQDVLTFDENEICDFEKIYQNYIIISEVEDPASKPELSVVDIASCNVKPLRGKKALKLVTRPGEYSYPRIIIPEKIMRESDLTKVPKKELDKMYFCFDLYAIDKTLTFYPEFFDSGYGICYNKWATDAVKGKWTTYRIKLSDLTESMVYKPGFFRLSWNCGYPSEYGELSFLIDGFRIEHV